MVLRRLSLLLPFSLSVRNLELRIISNRNRISPSFQNSMYIQTRYEVTNLSTVVKTFKWSINTRIMNSCLLVKWIWKIHQEPDELWFRLIKAKYLNGCNFFSAPSKGSSQFWKGLHKVKHLFKWGALFKVKIGLNCRFWHDC
jgi:hypothetical protein